VGSNSGIKVLYLMGSSRCGSTILGNILGEIDGFVSVGEVRHLWDRVIRNRLCGCGVLLSECEIWSKVLERTQEDAYGRVIEPRDVIEWQRATLRWHHTWRILRMSELSSKHPKVLAYSRVIGKIYRSVADLTRSHVIVDGTKHPPNGALLRLLPGIEPYFVHMVRDGRAVAHSRAKPKPNPDGNPPGELPGGNHFTSMVLWGGMNIASAAVCRRHGEDKSMRVRYEDFIADPVQMVRKITSLINERPKSTPFVDHHTVQLGRHHTVSGNPSRFEIGTVRLRHDDRWRAEMSGRNRLLTTTLGLPFLLRFGYPVRGAVGESRAVGSSLRD
jgi:hypothetical protein